LGHKADIQIVQLDVRFAGVNRTLVELSEMSASRSRLNEVFTMWAILTVLALDGNGTNKEQFIISESLTERR
jgi:hypothetical protein